MLCPFCAAQDTKVVDSRWVSDANQVRRRRECLSCCERFTTYENAELSMPRVVKRDGRRSSFDETKLRIGLLRALEKRPVSIAVVEETLHRIVKSVRSTGDKEISTKDIGNIAMEELRTVDTVAYIRFASVYLAFENASAFKDVLAELD